MLIMVATIGNLIKFMATGMQIVVRIFAWGHRPHAPTAMWVYAIWQCLGVRYRIECTKLNAQVSENYFTLLSIYVFLKMQFASLQWLNWELHIKCEKLYSTLDSKLLQSQSLIESKLIQFDTIVMQCMTGA